MKWLYLAFLTLYQTIHFLNSLPNDNISDWSQLEAFADGKIKVPKKLKFVAGRVENIVRIGEKCWLQAFFPFRKMFSKGF